MAPDVYLGILDVVRDGATVDHIIEMRRMPADRRLSALLGTDEALGQLRQVARTVAAFHAAQPPSDRAAHYGSLEQVAQRWQQNLAEMTELGSPWLPPDDLEKVGDLSRRYLAHRKPLFVQRIADGYVRDGHGDLLADDIFCLDDGPRIPRLLGLRRVATHR